MLADNLTATAPQIVVARLNCEEAERFCNDDIRISRTPEFKVGCHSTLYSGKPLGPAVDAARQNLVNAMIKIRWASARARPLLFY